MSDQQQLIRSGNGTAPLSGSATATKEEQSAGIATKATAAPGHREDGFSSSGHTLDSLPKSWRLTSLLPPDPVFPTPADSHRTPRDQITPRLVRGGLFTWVRPERQDDPELIAISPSALRDLGLHADEPATDRFRQWAAGNVLLGWDEERAAGEGYPWAQLYGGFQFGQWAGQLGDGRAISLFETPGAEGGRGPYEVQLKGAGVTPYSRFADGKAVLRSSIREFVVSEALHALGIPSTRALALTLLPKNRVVRENGFEPGAIVVRLARSWIRLGNFDILRARGERAHIRQLATYVAEEVLGGWDQLPARLDDDPDAAAPADSDSSAASTAPSSTPIASPARGVPEDELQGPAGIEENRFARLYREVVRRNAATVAAWQAYGFMNGVLNTDNTSICGLSIDFGPFAFLDDFDPAYTPNHDDHLLRYSYRNQPSIIWWNLVRLGEALGELLGSGPRVDDDSFVRDGVTEADGGEDGPLAKELVTRAESVITRAGDEYKAVFLAEYKRLMTARLGLRTHRASDFDELFSELLDTMEALSLDFSHFFRRLSGLRVATPADVDDTNNTTHHVSTPEARRAAAGIFFHKEGVAAIGTTEDQARDRIAKWLERWRTRILEDWAGADSDSTTLDAAKDEERMAAMRAVNPSFVPRSFVLDEIIRRVEKEGERDVLRRVMHMALHPFEDEWHGKEFEGAVYEGDREEELRWTGDVPKFERAMQCSCSS